MLGTKQVGIWSEMGSFWQPHPTQDQPTPPGGFEIDSRIGAAAPRAPAASIEDSRPQAILKFHRHSSLDYRVRHELPVGKYIYTSDAPEPTFWWAEPSFLTSEPSQAEL